MIDNLNLAVGQRAILPVGDLQFVVKIVDVKMGWGKGRFLITPETGGGTRWVELGTLLPLKVVAPTTPPKQTAARAMWNQITQGASVTRLR